MRVAIRLLGGFEVTLDGRAVPSEAWSRRQSSALVKLLALSPGRRRHREAVIEALWPSLSLDAAAPRLHKAAHYARRALGDDSHAIALRHETVTLLADPDADVVVDSAVFEAAARAAIADGTTAAAQGALELYGGPLLPDDPYEPWAEGPRDALRDLHVELLRSAGRWQDVLEEAPTDEEAHLVLARSSADRGDVRGALRQLERLDLALRRELGTSAGPEAARLKAQLEARTTHVTADHHEGSRLFGRRDVAERVRELLARAESGHGGTLVVTGPPGVGKSTVLDMAEALARRRGWRVGRGAASAVEGSWPYAPVLEALADMSRQHPALRDGLPDAYREEIERAISGQDVRWSGEAAHQRLFVAAAELVRLAAAGHGMLLAVDDLHDADEASLRLLHYLSRSATSTPVLLVVSSRPAPPAPTLAVLDSIMARAGGTRVELAPLSEATTLRLLGERFPDLPAEAALHIFRVSAGLPFTALEMAREHGQGTAGAVPVLPAPALQTLQRVALLGSTFTTDELLAVSGAGEDAAYAHLETALSALVVEPAESGYRFRHALLREAVVEQMPPHAKAIAHRDVAERLAELGAPPGRVAHHYVAAGLPSRAAPYVPRAAETAGALGAYRDGLALVDAVLQHTGPAELPRLLARRGDLLMSLGDPDAVAAYREAAAITTGREQRLVRARLARAAAFAGDFDTAGAAIEGLTLDGDDADGPILVARGNLAYFSGDTDAAWEAAAEARKLLLKPGDPWQYVDLMTLQGLIAHQRGEWFEKFRHELRAADRKRFIGDALFDAHLCVAEYLLYGPVPYEEVIELGESLRGRAGHAGVLRGVAFATALIGEAALLMDDLDRAETELTEAIELYHDIDAPAGEAHSLQRLAEVHLARGDHEAAQRLLQRGLGLARSSIIRSHLLQRIYGSMIEASEDPRAARALVDRAEAAIGPVDHCPLCDVMLAVPASIACSRVGDVEEARRLLAVAAESAERWQRSAWDGAVLEAQAHLARAEGREDEVVSLASRAAQRFAEAGHPRDAARCLALSSARSLSPLPR